MPAGIARVVLAKLPQRILKRLLEKFWRDPRKSPYWKCLRKFSGGGIPSGIPTRIFGRITGGLVGGILGRFPAEISRVIPVAASERISGEIPGRAAKCQY